MRARRMIVAGALLCLAALPWNGGTEMTTIAPASAQPVKAAQPEGGDGGIAPAGGIAPGVLRLALEAVQCAITRGAMRRPPTLTVIDYSRPSVERRLWVFDMHTGALLFKELVAHGRNTGENLAIRFSDALNSRQSSVGLFVTSDTYVGSNGYSLRLDGLEPGFNGRARARAIVMHGAPYVDASLDAAQGRIGRSWGCPAVRDEIARPLIDTIRGGGAVFSYYPDEDWLSASRFLHGCGPHVLNTVETSG